MQKIIVIGCPGSGKSTFATKLHEKTKIPLYHLDMIWHNPDKTTITREEFVNQLNIIFSQNSWIIDGNYQRTLPLRLEKCDTVFLLDFPTEICLAGAASRVGKNRPDLPFVETELDPEFKETIINFSKTKLPEIYKLLEEYKQKKNIIIFKSYADCNNYINSL